MQRTPAEGIAPTEVAEKLPPSGDTSVTVPTSDASSGAAATAEDANTEAEASFGTYFRIFKFCSTRDAILLAVSTVAAVASGTALALTNLVLGSFIDVLNDFASGASPGDDFMDRVSQYTLYFVYLGIARLVCCYVYSVLSNVVAHNVTRNLRVAYIRAALRQEVAFFDGHSSGSVAVLAASGGALVQSGANEKVALCIQAVSTFAASFIIAFMTDWTLTLILSCMVPALFVSMGFVAGLDAKVEVQMLGIFGKAAQFAEAVLGNVKTVHAFQARDALLTKYDGWMEEAWILGKKKSPIYALLFTLEYFIVYAGIALAFWQGINRYASGLVSSLGAVFTVLMSVIVATTTITALAPHTVAFSRASSAAAQLFKLIDRSSKIDPYATAGVEPISIKGKIELYRRRLALVQQEPALFPGSIRENVALAIPGKGLSPSEVDAQVEAACRAANAWDFICSLPEGLATPCSGAGGSQLSGGQRQRVAIARALARGAGVLVLDEATSALDSESEAVILSALEGASAGSGMITVAVAHRLSTIRNSDVICVFYGGRIAEAGSHGDLITRGGMYKAMCEAQSLDGGL